MRLRRIRFPDVDPEDVGFRDGAEAVQWLRVVATLAGAQWIGYLPDDSGRLTILLVYPGEDPARWGL